MNNPLKSKERLLFRLMKASFGWIAIACLFSLVAVAILGILRLLNIAISPDVVMGIFVAELVLLLATFGRVYDYIQAKIEKIIGTRKTRKK